MSHTLGPWEIYNRPRKSFASGELMYRVDGPEILFDYEDWGYTKESASLIAAAPELLEALKLAQSIIGHPDDAHSQHIAAVIAKAEGEKT
jgi:hypothetical protein